MPDDLRTDLLADLLADVARAAQVVAPSWPLSGTIAVNPLSGMEHLPFRTALERAGTLFGARGLLTLDQLRATSADGQAASVEAAVRAAVHRALPALPGAPPELGGRRARVEDILVADLLTGPGEPDPERTALTTAEQADRELGTSLQAEVDLVATEHCLGLAGGAASAPAPESARRLLDGLQRLGVGPADRVPFLEAHLSALPGWVAHLRWRDEHLGEHAVLDHLAVRVVAEADSVAPRTWRRPSPGGSPSGLDQRVAAVRARLGARPTDDREIRQALGLLTGTRRGLVWLDAYERLRHDPLLASLGPDPSSEEDLRPAALAQVVCCIDVRSEGLRRHLEAAGPYETFGYAGFFGLPVRVEPLTGGEGTDQLPVLLAPSATVREVPDPGHEHRAKAVVERHREQAAVDAAWRAAKHHPIAPLALAEAAGWPAGALAAARTAAPGLTAWLADRLRPGAAPSHHDRAGLSVADQAAWVAAIWRLGLGARLAPLVVLTGHASVSDNNPTESALACGACGGNPGGANARLAAAMANDPQVRAHLATMGVEIPEPTWFLAAEHDTTTDQVRLLDVEKVPEHRLGDVERLRHDLATAGEAAALERAPTLPGCDLGVGHRSRLRAVRRRGRDWAEPVAELGLAGNLAFVVGPRDLTRHLDLQRRVFLHSYDAAADEDGATLAGILTAPLVVAHWISAQYYFSTTDPEVFGSGSKAVHNPVGDIGLLSGPGGDLRRGLPLQSVRAGDRLLHEPVRLLAVVQGRLDHIDTAIAGSPTLSQLVANRWIHLVARPTPRDPWQQRRASGWSLRDLDAALSPTDAPTHQPSPPLTTIGADAR